MNGGIDLRPGEASREHFIQPVALAHPRRHTARVKIYIVTIVFSASEEFLSLASYTQRQADRHSFMTCIFIIKATSSF